MLFQHAGWPPCIKGTMNCGSLIIVNKLVLEVILFWGHLLDQRKILRGGNDCDDIEEVYTGTSKIQFSVMKGTKQCHHPAVELCPCAFVAIDLKAFQDQVQLKQKRGSPLGRIPALMLLVGGQVVNRPSGQICQTEIKREFACAGPS